MAPSIVTRIYTPNKSSDFKDQLNIWCDRVHIAHIKFNTTKTNYRDEYGHQLYEAVPIFPSIIVSGAHRYYDEAVPLMLADSNVIGWGTSKKEAEEMAAAALLNSRQYCYY
ncbi:hypothetical protein OPQ81_009283 [Rhizoctonia solani]|nr:hypothetical protein OPQ81_009283 [Rhizoctonia solani]